MTDFFVFYPMRSLAHRIAVIDNMTTRAHRKRSCNLFLFQAVRTQHPNTCLVVRSSNTAVRVQEKWCVWNDRGGHFDGVTQLRAADKTKSALFREKRDFSFSEFDHFSVRRALKENRIFVNQSWDQRSDAAHCEALIVVPKTCSVRPLSGSKTSSRAQDAVAK